MSKSSTSSPENPLGDDRFRVLVDSVKDYAIFMLDGEGRVQTWNAGAAIIKGYAADEIIGRHIDVFYTKAAREQGVPALLLARTRDEGRVEDEGWRVRKDGSLFWADEVITPLRNEGGDPIGYAKVVRDLTERRKAEETLREQQEELQRSEERFRLLVDSVEDHAMFMLDPQGIVATWNSGAQRIKGYAAREIVGKHFSVFRTEDEVQMGACAHELAEAARVGRLEGEGWRKRKDGTTFLANVVLTAMRNDSGTLIGFAKVTRDLTHRRMLEEEKHHRARAEEAVRVREEFLSVVSHELKTPLTALKIDLYAIKEHLADPDKLGKKIERAARNTDRLGGLIESLLNVSRISRGELSLRAAPMDLSETLGQVVEKARGTAAKAGCELLLDTNGPVLGVWDRARLDQVTMNLLANAMKFGAGGPVTLSVRTDQNVAVLQVCDRGPGIPEQDLSRVFGRFERTSPTRHYAGLGLGLYVSREIVEAMQGTIRADNRPGGGACFTVRLPLGNPIAAATSSPITSA